MLYFLLSPVVLTHVLRRRHSLPLQRRRPSPFANLNQILDLKVQYPISPFSLFVLNFSSGVFLFLSLKILFFFCGIQNCWVSVRYPFRTTMKAGKVNQEEDDYEEEDFGSSKKQGPSSASNTNKGTLFMFLFLLVFEKYVYSLYLVLMLLLDPI